MRIELSQQFNFDAAHTLRRTAPISEYESSAQLHGHTYFAEVAVYGEIGSDGFIRKKKDRSKHDHVLDLFYLREAIEKVRIRLDHKNLDLVEGLGAATLENLCIYIAKNLNFPFPTAYVRVWRATGDAARLTVNGG